MEKNTKHWQIRPLMMEPLKLLIQFLLINFHRKPLKLSVTKIQKLIPLNWVLWKEPLVLKKECIYQNNKWMLKLKINKNDKPNKPNKWLLDNLFNHNSNNQCTLNNKLCTANNNPWCMANNNPWYMVNNNNPWCMDNNPWSRVNNNLCTVNNSPCMFNNNLWINQICKFPMIKFNHPVNSKILNNNLNNNKLTSMRKNMSNFNNKMNKWCNKEMMPTLNNIEKWFYA